MDKVRADFFYDYYRNRLIYSSHWSTPRKSKRSQK